MKWFSANGNTVRPPWLYGGLVLASLVFALLQSGPLNGAKPALVVIVLSQLYLPGLLLARALGRLHSPHPISRFAWVLLCGLCLTVCLGGAARLLHVPVMTYVLLLHGVMLALALIRPPGALQADTDHWRFSRASLPLYGLLALCCLVVLAVGLERNQFRFNGFEDQTVFVSLADWLANDPDDPSVIDRRIGVPDERADKRWLTDGWTYNHAAWVWSSGVPAAALIWYDLTPLFVWITPLAVFALAYELTRRESAGVYSAAALTIAGLMTLDSLVYNPTTVALGQFALFQVNTLRAFSTALMLPLALLAAISYLRAPNRRDLLLVLLAGLAIASMHPRQIVIYQISVGLMAALWLLALPDRRRMMAAALVGLALLGTMSLPYIQRANRPLTTQLTEQTEETLIARAQDSATPGGMIVLRDLPLIGTTYIANPRSVFYHPVILLAVVIGLGAGWWWRVSLAAQYLFAATLGTLIVFFLPGVTSAIVRLISFQLFSGLIFMLPVALALGIAADALLQTTGRVALIRRAGQPLTVLSAALVMLLLLFEPLPIAASARDQIHASNSLQSTRDIQPFDEALLAALSAVLPPGQRSILMTPDHPANYIIESIPHTFITGGRASSNLAHPYHSRFFTRVSPLFPTIAPWLDTTDLDTIARYGVTHIVVQASDTRLPQLIMQPERFELLSRAAGFVIFAVMPGIQADAYDERFARMNALYGEIERPRWGPDGFALPRPADATPWRALAQDWREDMNGDDDRARYGLALAWLMMGEDELALPLWQNLHERYPSVHLFTAAVAHTRRMLDSAARTSVEPLLAALQGDDPQGRTLAARELLSEWFLYLLGGADIEQIIAVTEAETITWHHLAQFDQPQRVREQAVLMLSAGHPETAARWVNALPPVELSPQDMVLHGSILLAQGDASAALTSLEPATDYGWYAPNARFHPDRWQTNTAAQLYDRLRRDTGDVPEADSPWLIAQAGALFVMTPEITQDADRLHVTATFGNPQGSVYPVQTWRVQLTSPDTSIIHASVDAAAYFDPAALTRATITLDIPPDTPELTPALVFITPLYNEAIAFPGLMQRVTLNPPADAAPPPSAQAAGYLFDSSITLEAYTLAVDDQALRLTLYWQAQQRPAEDYQVFIHVLDEAGKIVLQRDSAPLDGRYPTGDWRPGLRVADTHVIAIDPPLPPGSYQITTGLYRLPDGARLLITPADERTAHDALQVGTFTQ